MSNKTLVILTTDDYEVWDNFQNRNAIQKDENVLRFPIEDNNKIIVIKQQRDDDSDHNKTKEILMEVVANINGSYLVAHHEKVKDIKFVASRLYKPFNHSPHDKLWENYLIPLSKENSYFDKTWDFLTVGRVQYLRDEILLPFIPLHLAAQGGVSVDEDWQKIIEKCCNIIKSNELNRTLQELLQIASINDSSNVSNSLHCLTELCKQPPELLDKNKIMPKIEKFATCLEGVVNYIEFGEPVICRE